MEKSFASFTIFTFLLLAVSTARISLNPPATNLPVLPSSHVESKTMKSLPGPATTENSNIILPSETPKSSSDQSVRTPVTKTFKVDLTPRSEFARFHAINRHFFDEPRIPIRSVHRRPNRHFVNPFVIPRSEISHGNDVLFAETKVDAKHFHRQSPLKRLKANKHDYRNLRHRHQLHHHFHHRDNNDVSRPKHMFRQFSREKLRSLERQHKEKRNQREHEASFMKGIRKFLKHTFD